LGEVCDLQNGFAFKSTDYIEFSNTVNFRMSQIRPGGGVDLENNPKYLPDEYAITYKDYLLKEGDIVIAMTDMATETKILGVPTIVPSDSRNWLLNQRVGKLFNIDKSKVNIAFLKYILVSEPINEYYKKLGRGGLQINIGKQDILNAKIPLPPLPEQQRIVSILDEAFAAIAKAKANAEQNLKNAKELFESYLQSVFENKGEGWEEERLEQCFKLRSGDGLTSKNMSEGGEFPVFGGNGIAGLHNSFNLSGGNVIIGRVGALCGNVRHITEKIWLTDNAFKIVDFKYNFDNAFLTYLLNFKNLRGYARQAAQPVISNSSLKEVLLQFPKSRTEQQTIVHKLDALSAEIKKLEVIYQQKINDLEELKKSILQKAFSGELKTSKEVAA
jgi:type I restriction enzyme, S subunit